MRTKRGPSYRHIWNAQQIVRTYRHSNAHDGSTRPSLDRFQHPKVYLLLHSFGSVGNSCIRLGVCRNIIVLSRPRRIFAVTNRLTLVSTEEPTSCFALAPKSELLLG